MLSLLQFVLRMRAADGGVQHSAGQGIWHGVDPAFVWAASGSSLRIVGQGFNVAGSGSYQCLLDGPISNRTVQATLVTDTSVICNVPAEAVEEPGIHVHLLHNGVKVEQANRNLPASFSVKSRSHLSPSLGGASGGTVVSLKVYGLPPSSADDIYMCNFRAGRDSMTSIASIIGDVQLCERNGSVPCTLKCISPPFGLDRPGTTAHKGNYLDGIKTELNIVRGPACARDGMETSTSGCACNGTQRTFIGSPRNFVFFSTHASTSRTEGYAIGGQDIELRGSALITGATYECEFSNEHSKVASPAFRAVNNTVSCQAPRWHAMREPTVNVSLVRLKEGHEKCTRHVVQKQDSARPMQLTYVPVWTSFWPPTLRRDDTNQCITIKGWGFQEAMRLMCEIGLVRNNMSTRSGQEVGSVIASNISSNQVQCCSSSWDLLPSYQSPLELILHAGGRKVVGMGHERIQVFVLRHGRSQPIRSMMISSLCPNDAPCAPRSRIRVPQDRSINITWIQPDLSPYTWMAMASDPSCLPTFWLKLFKISSGPHFVFNNNLKVTGRLFVCYSMEGQHGEFVEQSNVAIVSEEQPVTLMNYHQDQRNPPSYFRLRGGALRHLLVASATSPAITAISPEWAEPGVTVNVSFMRTTQNDVVVALAPQGQCSNASSEGLPFMLRPFVLRAESTRNFTLGAGVYSVCLCEDCNASQVDGAQDEIVGTYVEQADLVLRVTPAARTDSILRLDPEAIVAGTANISFQGFFVSRGSYVALSSSPTCQPGWDANILRLCLCLCFLLFWFCVGGSYFVSDAARRLCLLSARILSLLLSQCVKIVREDISIHPGFVQVPFGGRVRTTLVDSALRSNLLSHSLLCERDCCTQLRLNIVHVCASLRGILPRRQS